MLTVDIIGRIRRDYFIGKKTIREISRSLKVSQKVIRKAIRTPSTEFVHVRQRQVQPQLGAFVGQLNKLLEENVRRSARKRLTARRLYELLGAEGHVGAYDSIQRHVRAWRRDHGKTDAVFVRFCQISRRRACTERQDKDRSAKRHDVECNAGASGEADAAGRGGNDLVVTATRSEEIGEFAVLATEAAGGVVALEAAHTSDPALMPRWSCSSRLFK